MLPSTCGIVLRLLVGIWFQVLFHSPSGGSFHLSLTVLVHYRSPKVFSLGEWTPPLRTGLACPVLLRYPTSGSALSHTGLSPSMVGRSRTVLLTPHRLLCQALQPRPASRAVWAAPRSLATTCGILSLPRGTEMFQFPRCPSPTLCVQAEDTRALTPGGLPHSEICGLAPADGSPQLIAVYHVLLRPLAPRHPPYTLPSLFSGYD